MLTWLTKKNRDEASKEISYTLDLLRAVREAEDLELPALALQISWELKVAILKALGAGFAVGLVTGVIINVL